LISLLDGQHQYILAEATPTMPLRSDRRHIASNELWLGNVRIPRSSGVCERVLALDSQDPNVTERSLAIIIGDMTENDQLRKRYYVKDGPKWRFYAGVPMVSPHGAIIGAFCIFDDKPRNGLSPDSLALLHDMAATAVEHLATYKLREENRRGERMVRGLTSFLAGADSLQQSQTGPDVPHEPQDSPKSTIKAGSSQDLSTGIKSEPASRPPATHKERSASSILQDSILPPNAKSMFSRAANIMRETNELDGVVIFDASIAGVGGQRTPSSLDSSGVSPSQSHNNSLKNALHGLRQHDTSCAAHDAYSSDSSNPSSRIDKQRCQILGFSCVGQSSVAGDTADANLQSLTEHDLKKLLKMYSSGKVLNFGVSEAMTSSDDSTKDDDSAEDKSMITPRRTKKREGMKKIMDIIRAVAPGARSVCFLPLWDYDRSRWFVGCFFWTTQEDRLLSPTLDLVYLKAFGNSVMTELSRLHEIASNKTKTTFAASISHELRSPLHGILGGIEFLQSTSLDAFQTSMLHSTAICKSLDMNIMFLRLYCLSCLHCNCDTTNGYVATWKQNEAA
jgi:hypothetical protein